ncbi:N-acetyl-gamma-glutamyl-phosphate reductase [Thermovibrio sp.]
MQGISGQSVNVAVIGASGYTGAELLRLLLYHPFFKVKVITSRKYEGKKLAEVFPNFLKSPVSDLTFEPYNPEKISKECQLVFSCLPHRASFPVVKELLSSSPSLKVVDFSADFRFSSPETYERIYKVEHGAKELFKEAVYGLPELKREEIKERRLVANPGCYPTSVILALLPAVKEGILDLNYPVIADSKSGVSGAGRKESLDLLFCEVNESFKAYSVEDHRHGPEIAEKLGIPSLRFTPHLVPMNRGILSTVYFKSKASLNELKELYLSFYLKEPFVRLSSRPPKTQQVVGTNFCDVYLTQDKESGLTVAVSVIDNLVKGASGQAVQNANLLFGFSETLGLEHYAPVV